MQTSDQARGRAPGEIQAPWVPLCSHHCISLLFARVFKIISEEINKSEGHGLCICRKGIQHMDGLLGERLNCWGRFSFCGTLIVIKSQADFTKAHLTL